jgi:hypothetical protein
MITLSYFWTALIALVWTAIVAFAAAQAEGNGGEGGSQLLAIILTIIALGLLIGHALS